jgi:phosphonate transport system substrate-binding protein
MADEREVAFSAMSSNSGSRAPMVVLNEEFHLMPGRDYSFVFTGDQLRSMKDLAAGKHDAICVANDYFARQLAKSENNLVGAQFRSIYKSKSFPPLCFGVPHNLTPKLRKDLEEALKLFPLAGSGVPLTQARFEPVNYKLDWTYVRDMDEALGRLAEGK